MSKVLASRNEHNETLALTPAIHILVRWYIPVIQVEAEGLDIHYLQLYIKFRASQGYMRFSPKEKKSYDHRHFAKVRIYVSFFGYILCPGPHVFTVTAATGIHFTPVCILQH